MLGVRNNDGEIMHGGEMRGGGMEGWGERL